jgi:glucose-6-phosphate 1-dehydrogenase
MKIEILIVGGDGDLAIRKLYPALFTLDAAAYLDAEVNITGMSRHGDNKEAFIKKIKDKVSTFENFDENTWERFSRRINQLHGDVAKPEHLSTFKDSLDLDNTRLIIYLATPPKIFGPACRALEQAGLATANTQIVVEKPLGTNRESFLQVNAEMISVFKESQIYRIDHYLGKEAVQNLLAIRFANVIFGAIWNNNYIDHVQITVAETVGVEDRHEFYEETGTLRDMVQNHLLQVLCLVAMEPPVNRDAEMIRSEKLKVLKSLKPIELNEIQRLTVRGQYVGGSVNGELVPGYHEELGKNKETSTETFVAIKAQIDNWRWSGVPFYLRTGKRMPVRTSEIHIQFKPLLHNIFSDLGLAEAANQLVIRLQPDEGMRLHFLNKHSGLGDQPMEELQLNLSVPESRKKRSFDAYARLLLEVLNEDQALFVSADEVEASWQWIDQIINHWQRSQIKAHRYAAGTQGPSQSVALMARDGREWSELYL